MSSTSTSEVIENEELFEKHRGQRRWLGKEHHKGKDRLYDMVKDRVLIQKTIESSQPMSKNSICKIASSSNDDFGLNVYYSMDKKNRWKNNNVDLLKAAPTDVHAEVVERNIVNEQSTFSVHAKVNTNDEDPSDFEIRSSTSSGPGQHYSNFLPESRELSKKSKKKNQKSSELEEVKETEPTVTYNILKAHRSKDVVGAQMMQTTSRSKVGKHRTNKKTAVERELYDTAEDLEFSEDEENSVHDSDRFSSENIDLSQFIVESAKQKRTHRKISSSVNSEEFDFVEPEFETLFNIQQYLNQVGYTFVEAEVLFPNMSNMSFDREIENLVANSNVSVRYFNPIQVLIDASKWSQTNGNLDGETSLVIQLTRVSKNTLHILINSTVATHFSKNGPQHIRNLISSSKTVYEAISRVCRQFISNRAVIKSMRDHSKYINTKSFSRMIKDSSEWQNTLMDLEEPNRGSWACSKDVLSAGVKQEWDHVCEMVRETYTSHATSSDKSGNIGSLVCSQCTTNQPSFSMFQVLDGTNKCRDCLRKSFYADFEADRLPIDLEISDPTSSKLNTFDFLSTIVPLPILNMYTRKQFENIYHDLGATGVFDHCDNCKSTVYFEDHSHSDRSCPCGFCWCSKCESAPHWPMTCQQYSAWDNKWSRKYELCKAQGNGNDTLMKIVCECQSAVFDVRLPTETAECPKCHKKIELETMDLICKGQYFRWHGRYRKYIYAHFDNPRDLYRTSVKKFEPVEIKYSSIADVPEIKKSVVEICSAARDLRLDSSYHQKIKSIESELVKKGDVESGDLESIMGSILYLVENVTGWMYIADCFDRNTRKALDSLMLKREELLLKIKSDNMNSVEESIKKIRKDIKSTINSVEQQLEVLRSEIEQ